MLSIIRSLLLETVLLLLLQLFFRFVQLRFIPEAVVSWVELERLGKRGPFEFWVNTAKQNLGFIAPWIVVFINDVTDSNPFLDDAWSKLLLAVEAKIFNLSLLRPACVAEIVKEDVNLEVLRQDLPFVLADVFWAQLHLSRVDVVAALNKPSVEHDAAECVAGESLMSEQNFDVSAHRPPLLLLICQHESCCLFLLAVVPLRWISEQLRDVKPLALIDLKERIAAVTRKRWDPFELDSTQALDARRLNLLPIECLKIIEIA